MYIPDLSKQQYTKHNPLKSDGRIYLSVGWLGNTVEQSQMGKMPKSTMVALVEAKASNQLLDSWRGLHTCEICNNHHEKGEFAIFQENICYVLPNMVIHYIEEHSYKLPDEVIKALR